MYVERPLLRPANQVTSLWSEFPSFVQKLWGYLNVELVTFKAFLFLATY